MTYATQNRKEERPNAWLTAFLTFARNSALAHVAASAFGEIDGYGFIECLKSRRLMTLSLAFGAITAAIGFRRSSPVSTGCNPSAERDERSQNDRFQLTSLNLGTFNSESITHAARIRAQEAARSTSEQHIV
ncbi:MAG: hypothetical protein GC184_13670 [Rhizobiales bacterium]|nr:hypothetical protein [Hyphomicrobiales bacterium]